MHPITLRIPNDLLSEIDSEAEELGYSTRAEYIRQLLQNRAHAREALSTEGSIEYVDPETVQSNTDQIDSLAADLDDITDRLDQIERIIKNVEFDTEKSSQAATPSESIEKDGSDPVTDSDDGNQYSDEDLTTSVATETAINDLEEWLVENGPTKETAREIVIRAAEILHEDGPLSTGELKDRLYNEYPDEYKSKTTLWGSTVENVYEEAPGFSKPGYGEYDFE